MKNKKLKYGSFAVALTVTVLAVIIIINAIFSAVVQSKSLYMDMTKEKLYTISPEADAVYSNISNKNIDIIFFTEPDVMLGYEYQKLIYEYALKLEDKYDFITVKYIDSVENPEAVKPYLSSTIPQVYTTDVIVTNGDAFIRHSMDSFYTFDEQTEEVFGFNVEHKFATTFMQLAYEKMLACFTVGHNESTASSQMYSLFEEAGYEIKEIDLKTEDIPEEASVLIINDPQWDFTGAYDEVNEIAKIDSFLDRMGDMMVFCDPTTAANLPNLNEYLTEWGISFVPAHIEDKDHAIDTAGQSVIAEYTADGIGKTLNQSLREAENPPKTILSNAMPIEILWDQHNSISVGSILETSDTATAYSLTDNSVVKEGNMAVMTISMFTSREEFYDDGHAYVLAAGTKAFADKTYLNGNTYGNSDIIYAAMRAFGKEMVPVDLDMKVFDDQALDISLKQANAWTVVLVALLPTVVLTVGAVVLIRRRHL